MQETWNQQTNTSVRHMSTYVMQTDPQCNASVHLCDADVTAYVVAIWADNRNAHRGTSLDLDYCIIYYYLETRVCTQ